jgi:hypothetical protein
MTGSGFSVGVMNGAMFAAIIGLAQFGAQIRGAHGGAQIRVASKDSRDIISRGCILNLLDANPERLPRGEKNTDHVED